MCLSGKQPGIHHHMFSEPLGVVKEGNRLDVEDELLLGRELASSLWIENY